MKRLPLLVLLITLIAAPAVAAVSDEDIAALREQLAVLSERLDGLAAENARLRSAAAAPAAESQTTAGSVPASWPDRIALAGDFRYRYETIDAEGSPSRKRNRIRARANLSADVSEDIEVGFGLATGDSDPVSSNQTLGDGGSSKGVVLNLAYVDWQIADGLHALGGKFRNPMLRPGKQALLWDGDWTPEGLAFSYQRNWFFANAIGTFLEGDSRSSNENFSWGAQIGASGEIGGIGLKGGIGYFSIRTAGETTTFGDASDPGDYFGNTAVEAGGLACGTTPGVDCVYRYDYLLTELFGEASFELGDLPVSLFFDYVQNGDASDDDTAWMLGTRIGQAKDRGQWQFSYFYSEKEADAVLGLLTDSDFAGGGTDNKGHFLQLEYGLGKAWTIGAQYFINETDIRSGSGSDYDRLMLDTRWKWK